jgi:transcriptional regulator with XRE-family HTH domain
MNFGEKLKTLRTINKKTQKDIAEYLGITIAAYSYYENNLRRPDYGTLGKIASYYGSSYEYLLDEDEYGDCDPMFDAIFKRYSNLIIKAKKIMSLIDDIDSNIDSSKKYEYYLETLSEIYSDYQSAKEAVKTFINVDNLEDAFEDYLDDMSNL